MATIFFFDPFPIAGIGFTQILSRLNDNLHCHVVLSIEGMKKIAEHVDPDLIILSINTSVRPEAVRLLEHCRNITNATPIILYDESYSVDLMNRWSRYNIHGYLAKSEPVSLLLQSIQVAMGGGKYLSPLGWNRYLGSKGDGSSAYMRLGLKEFEIAWYLSDGKSTTWIAERMGRAKSTVSTMKKRIFTKMNVDNVVDLSKIIQKVNHGSMEEA